jgi:hypothetical protein
MTMDPPYLRSSHSSMATVVMFFGTENGQRRIVSLCHKRP